MVSKKIDLGNGLEFESITAGKAHFDALLKNAPLSQHFTGNDLQQINALYDAYCRATNWINKSPVAAFFPMNERGKGYTTRCFGITFADGSTHRFSLDKALSAIAK